MGAYLDKWNKLTKDFQTAIKGESLWSKDVQEVNRNLLSVVKVLDKSEVEVMDACGNRKGLKPADAAGYLATFKLMSNSLRAGTQKAKITGELNNTDKATKPKTYRALKVLATGIDDIASLAEYKAKTFDDAVANVGRQLSADERKAEVQALALTQVKKGVMKALAGLQKIKAEPTPLRWTNTMNDGLTRDLIMGLTSLHIAQGKGAFGGVPAALAHKNATAPWNTGQASSAVNDADTPVIIAAKAKQWSAIVKAVAADYQAHW